MLLLPSNKSLLSSVAEHKRQTDGTQANQKQEEEGAGNCHHLHSLLPHIQRRNPIKRQHAPRVHGGICFEFCERGRAKVVVVELALRLCPQHAFAVDVDEGAGVGRTHVSRCPHHAAPSKIVAVRRLKLSQSGQALRQCNNEESKLSQNK